MLTGSKTTFKVRQMVPDIKERMLSHSGVNARGRDVFGLRCLPGECVLQRAVLVRKKLTAKDGGGWLSGTLFCTHFRVAFVPQDSPKPDDNADPVLLGDHDVALASIEKVVAVGPSRTKLVTASSSLKFTPEELVLYCRDLRVLCFLFDRLTPDTQAVEVTRLLIMAQTCHHHYVHLCVIRLTWTQAPLLPPVRQALMPQPDHQSGRFPRPSL